MARSSAKTLINQGEFDFNSAENQLPRQEQFPLNIKRLDRSVSTVILQDIQFSTGCLIVTGFTSLSQIIDVFGGELGRGKHIRIILGFEPLVVARKRWKAVPLEQEMKDYWLEQGFSPTKCGAVIETINRIRDGQILFKTKDRLHAKLYVTDTHATLGSSNFSKSGLQVQSEANVRFAKIAKGDVSKEYQSINAIAEYYFRIGIDYSEKIVALLGELLRVVDWKEALARAVSELLESDYVREYLKVFESPGQQRLWPSQKHGIHQGLQILQEQGSLLVADPTGAGKTRMLSTLQLAVVNWLWTIGRGNRSNSLVVAPPLVLNSRRSEQLQLQKLLSDPISQGVLSMPNSYHYKIANEKLRIANVLVIDEAHNYLNTFSIRSNAIAQHVADFVILSTATPINKRAEDLLRLVELLDPDNLGDDELADFKQLYTSPKKALEDDPDVLRKLRSYIWKFTLRRTKSDLNELVDSDRAAYTNVLGECCRYPDQKHEVYQTGETDEDKRLADEVDRLAQKLQGVIYLRTLRLPFGVSWDVDQKRKYVQQRLRIAQALSVHRVRATLRSSRAALIELIYGTKHAVSEFRLDMIPKQTGDVLSTIDSLERTTPEFPELKDFMPEWLKDPEQYKVACETEREIYRRIASLAVKISDSREQGKAGVLTGYMKRHSLVVAFDHTIITLYVIEKMLQEQKVDCQIASGGGSGHRQSVIDQLKLGSTVRNKIFLCSDSMSEGVNLQASRAMVILDMPSLLRLAEQRIGRIDQMDSDHSRIFIYWPNDSESFALKADAQLIRTTELTQKLLGANIRLPDALYERLDQVRSFTAAEVIDELKKLQAETDQEWDGVNDAFSDVRRLVSGPNSLIDGGQYDELKNSQASVRCKVSFVGARSSWCFIALRGRKERVNRWLLSTTMKW
ncbi:SNF2-related protein [Flaviaesturariibacter amylovorans]|uniref:Helicase n=1 Tax=Flaviaesturariibacter amylovorans TaxID=1084520 RepID=A0ABP8H4X6_9BACT